MLKKIVTFKLYLLLFQDEFIKSVDGKIISDLVPMLLFADPVATLRCKEHWEMKSCEFLLITIKPALLGFIRHYFCH